MDVNFRLQQFADRTHLAADFNDGVRGCIRNRNSARRSRPGMGTSYGKDRERIIRIMELISDNFSRRLHRPETISPIRRTSPLGIAQPSDRSGNQGPAASTSPSSYAFGASRCASTVACTQTLDGAARVYRAGQSKPRLPKTDFSSP